MTENSSSVTVYDNIPVEGMLYFLESQRTRVTGKDREALLEAEEILRKYETSDENFQVPGVSSTAYGVAYDEFIAGVNQAVETYREIGVAEDEIDELLTAQEKINQLVDGEWETRKNQWKNV